MNHAHFFSSFLLLFLSVKALAEPVRVSGTYEIKRIEKSSPHQFKITFSSAYINGRLDRLELETDHLHMGLKEGQRLKISAEVLDGSGSDGKIAQILIFLESDRNSNKIPIWLLSSVHKWRPLRGARYLEMHSPTNDYMLF